MSLNAGQSVMTTTIYCTQRIGNCGAYVAAVAHHNECEDPESGCDHCDVYLRSQPATPAAAYTHSLVQC